MTLPKNRSGSVRKIYVKAPKRKTIHYKRREKGKKHCCPISGQRLPGVISSKGKAKRPNRKFGGNLSSSASSQVIKLAARIREGSLKLEDVDFRLRKYVEGLLAKK